MIKSILKRLVQLLFLLIISYAGSFIVVEEYSEKTEKTERSEEALHSHYHSKRFHKAVAIDSKKKSSGKQSDNSITHVFSVNEGGRNFNVDHIYFTSHLITI